MDRANAFAEHLEGVFTPFDRCSPEDGAETARLLAEPSRDADPIRPATEEETAELITIMSNNKAPGDDGINAIALKMLPPPSIQLITRTYNRCLEIGYFPSTWKRAQVTMIPKPGKPEANLSSYRPISLLPMLSKILERVFLSRALPVFDEAGLIPDHQFGFSRRHGTPEKCHQVVLCILYAFETKKSCMAVMLDVKQAFDPV
ncbi:hypothetical protein KR026_009012 [Drosophila bipectinata]|nr:hypothetical protein KR026_009012 [Drosophila bipectinata]